MTTAQALLADIIAKPADDLPRLVYCDWLEENAGRTKTVCPNCSGECVTGRREGYGSMMESRCWKCHGIGYVMADNRFAERAEFIRRSIHSGLAFYPEFPGEPPPFGDWPFPGSWVGRRGFVAEWHGTAVEWLGEVCSTCHSLGLYCSGLCHGEQGWRSGGCGPLVLAAHPIEAVVPTDMTIFGSLGNDTYYVGNLGSFPDKYWKRLDNLPSRWHARKALSDVLIELVRPQPVPA